VIWDPSLAAAERQAHARSVVNGEGIVGNVQYYVAARRYADA
jgi:sulfonate transport system substrate-binding protein